MSPRRAFTLIEILMVIALIGIVAGFAVSRFDYRGYRMDSSIRFLQNVIIGAQQSAITRNVRVQVMFDANMQRVRVLQDRDNSGHMSGSDSVRYRPLFEGAEFQAPATTLDGASAAYMTGPGVVETGNPLQLSVWIEPNGTLRGDAVVYIGSTARDPNNQRAMTIVGATARTGFWSRSSGSWRQRNN
jgi:prepilin-type N-terminal cleavage/methylation domain-containing protein